MPNGDLSAILTRHGYDPTRLVQILRDLMAAEGRLRPKSITELSTALHVPRARVEGVAGFYSFFSGEDRGRFRVLFSDNITDEMSGSVHLRQRMLDAFDVRLGEVSRDGLVSIDTTSCTGLCDQGPALLVNGHAIARLTPARIGAICSLIRGGSPVEAWPENLFPIDTHIERKGPLLETSLVPGAGITAAVRRGPERTIAEMKAARLRGRGGAGLATGLKWEACRNAAGTERVVIGNADEGEPGTFKDRVLLAEHLDLVLEGMTVAAFAVGARRGFLYVRGEYSFLARHIDSVLTSRRRAGLLGEGVAGVSGFDFDVDVHWGAGAYVCGEESALIESLEGKRGVPRNRPPYPVTHGYLQMPSVVNNVETLAAAALIAVEGGSWFCSSGTAKSAGTKLISVSGDVARPGIYEYPFGVAVSQILADSGAADTQAVQVGGPSGTLLARNEFHRRISFEDVSCAGAFMVFDESRDILAVVDNFARFFAHESCGFCTPCRVGATLVRQVTRDLRAGRGTRRDVEDVLRVAAVMKSASHCGLGATAGNPVIQALEKFRPLFDQRLASTEVVPSFDLDAALAPAREATGRDDPGAHFLREDT